MKHTLRRPLTDADKRALLEAVAQQVNKTAQKYGTHSPQYAAAKAQHADLCKQLGY